MKTKVFYHKIYRREKEEKNIKKHTITEDQVNNIVSMMNSEDERDVDMAIKILSNSNCNQCYDDVIWMLIKETTYIDFKHIKPKWAQLTSKDGTNKRIIRFMK